ncbi:MAG TPA: hypothetical protein VFS67_10905 [Polyangiaceae bacterium]|jgi:uncharacterized membrane protein|nr:hypothetical protein [Polyangiaceae bacterium]
MNTQELKHRYSTALAWGALCGLRSMSGPVLADHRPRRFARGPLQRQLARPAVARTLQALAVAELIADKLPFVPARIQLPSLIARATSGAVTALAAPPRRRWRRARLIDELAPALVAALAAVASAGAAYSLRRALTRRLRLPTFVGGLLEDALLFAAAARLRG